MFLKKLYLILLPAILIIALPAFMRPGPSPKSPASMPDCPVIDYSNRVIKRPDCGKSNGSITGIIVTSTGTKITYEWRDEDGNIMGHAADLLNIPAGIYTLTVTDNSGCTAMISTPSFKVLNLNAVTIDDSRIVIKNSSCKNDGAISGITGANASTYTWVNTATNTTISVSHTTADISNLAPGHYQLTASNNSCQDTKDYYVNTSIILPEITSHNVTDAPCGGNGNITVTLRVSPQQPRVISSFQDMKTGTHLYDGIITADIPNPVLTTAAPKGTYGFYVEDPSGCAVLLSTYTVRGDTSYVDKLNSVLTNDRCNQHLGSIVPALVGISGPTVFYKWYKSKGVGKLPDSLISQNKVLTRVGAGLYRLSAGIKGSLECMTSGYFTIIDNSPDLPPPIAKGTTICVPGMINITVTNTDTSKLFRLYDSPTSETPIDSSRNGIFYRNVDQTADFYVARVVNHCESDRTEVTETVVASFKRPNAFTPNGDGINDFWDLEGIDKFPGADVTVFTRNGQQIYHSVNYAVPFDGTYNGTKLPAGVYYYIIDLKQPICYGKISGSLTIIR
ncbi:MAG: gliding motility-associated C-terminal domain-containing protein [Bacteroidetes bacterium]|nr:gliding motility-associated C-terminal domain-containing protein [Bacteroidota bacterium]